MDQQTLSVGFRWLHVLAMSLALGGAGLLTMLTYGSGALAGAALHRAAIAYERIFWAATGVLVMTGVGNIASFGTHLPARDSEWGVTLVTKLGFVVALMLLSIPRTLAIVQLASHKSLAAAGDRLIGRLYMSTLALLLLILALALWLSHG